MPYSAQELIDLLHLQSHPEGGWFAFRGSSGHPIPADVGPRRPGDPPRLIACSDLAKKELGWKPEYEHAGAIIESVWKWLQKQTELKGYRRLPKG